jgi:3-hydroxyisobutyrate dehydrogenase-like beta-hydroxyacid dehydrogenase
MAEHLVIKGHNDMYVLNKTASKADGLVKLGENYMESPITVAIKIDVLFQLQGNPHDFKNLLFNS